MQYYCIAYYYHQFVGTQSANNTSRNLFILDHSTRFRFLSIQYTYNKQQTKFRKKGLREIDSCLSGQDAYHAATKFQRR